MKKTLLSILALTATILTSQAQESSAILDKISFGASYGIVKPMGKFGNHHFSAMNPSNIDVLTEGDLGALNLADFLDNSFAKQGNQFSIFAEYQRDDHFGAFLEWNNAEFSLHQGQISSMEVLFNQVLESQGGIIPTIGFNVTQWKSNSFLAGPTARQSYGKFTIQTKAGIGVLLLESPTFTASIEELFGFPVALDILSLPQEEELGFVYSLGLSAQYEFINKTSFRVAMDYSKSMVKMENIALQLLSSDLPLDIPAALMEPVEIEVDYQTLNFSLSLIRQF